MDKKNITIELCGSKRRLIELVDNVTIMENLKTISYNKVIYNFNLGLKKITGLINRISDNYIADNNRFSFDVNIDENDKIEFVNLLKILASSNEFIVFCVDGIANQTLILREGKLLQ